MKKLLLLTATLIIAVCFVSCRDKSKMEKSDRTLYAQDLTDALCLESVPMEPPMEAVIPSSFGDMELLLNDDDLWKYPGKVGYVPAIFHFTIEWDKVSDGQICGYVEYDSAYEIDYPVTGLLIKKNEPNPNGFNKVVFEELSPNGDVLGTFEGIVEGRGDGFNGDYKKAGEDTAVKFESMREY